MIANRMKPALAALALAAAFASIATPGAYARDRHDDNRGSKWGDNKWGDRGHGYQRVDNSRRDRQGDGRRNRPAEIDRGLGSAPSGGRGNSSSPAERGNAFGGNLETYVLDGNGILFDRDYLERSLTGSIVVLAPKAKIIDVRSALIEGAHDAIDGCSYEVRVCVIRGGN